MRTFHHLALACLTLSVATAAQTADLFDQVKRDDSKALAAHLRAQPAAADLVDTRDDLGMTLLHTAADTDAKDCVRLLVAAKAQLDLRAYNRFTPLHLAASRGHVASVKLLVAAGADLEARSAFDETALQMAAHNRRRTVVELLRNAGAVYDIETAVLLGDLPWVERCLADPDIRVAHATVQLAVQAGRTDLVRLLLPRKNPPEPLPFGPPLPTLPYFALRHADTLNYLLEQGEDLHARFEPNWAETGATLLHVAAQLDAVPSLQLLLQKGLPIDSPDALGGTPLLHAVRAGAVGTTRELLRRGAKTAGPWGDLLTLGTHGMQRGIEPNERERRRQVGELLLAHGLPITLDAAMALQRLADVERLLREQPALAVQKDPVPPLCRAAKYTEPAYLRLLLAAGADVDAADPDGYTPLHWAAFWGDLPAVELLLQHRAKVSPAATNGLTPLHESVRLGHPDVTKRLLEAGADRDARCRAGMQPLDYAEPGPLQQRFRTLLAGSR